MDPLAAIAQRLQAITASVAQITQEIDESGSHLTILEQETYALTEKSIGYALEHHHLEAAESMFCGPIEPSASLDLNRKAACVSDEASEMTQFYSENPVREDLSREALPKSVSSRVGQAKITAEQLIKQAEIRQSQTYEQAAQEMASILPKDLGRKVAWLALTERPSYLKERECATQEEAFGNSKKRGHVLAMGG